MVRSCRCLVASDVQGRQTEITDTGIWSTDVIMDVADLKVHFYDIYMNCEKVYSEAI